MSFKPGRTFYDKYGNKYVIKKVFGDKIIYHFTKSSDEEISNELKMERYRLQDFFVDKFYMWGKPNEN